MDDESSEIVIFGFVYAAEAVAILLVYLAKR